MEIDGHLAVINTSDGWSQIKAFSVRMQYCQSAAPIKRFCSVKFNNWQKLGQTMQQVSWRIGMTDSLWEFWFLWLWTYHGNGSGIQDQRMSFSSKVVSCFRSFHTLSCKCAQRHVCYMLRFSCSWLQNAVPAISLPEVLANVKSLLCNRPIQTILFLRCNKSIIF